jgi:hypothetical protein
VICGWERRCGRERRNREKLGGDNGVFSVCFRCAFGVLSVCFRCAFGVFSVLTYHTRSHNISWAIGFVHFNAIFFSCADVLHPDGAQKKVRRAAGWMGTLIYPAPAQSSAG